MRVLLAAALLFFALLPARLLAAPQPVNGIVAIVGDEVITLKDIEGALRDDFEMLQRRHGHQPEVFARRVEELRRAKLEEMVDDRLVLQEFKRAGYVVPESLFQSRLEDEIKRFFGDRLTMTQTLQRRGITFENYRERSRERVILDLMWREKVPRDPLISPSKIENYYVQNRDQFKMEDQVKLRMIVLTNNPSNPSFSPMRIAEEIVAKLDQKVPFEELARVYSQGSQAQEGGDWGWVEKRVLNTTLAEVAFSLAPGQHSRPVQTPAGAYVLSVEDKRVSYTKTLAEVRDDIENTLRAEELKRLRKQWVDQLKAKSFVRYF